jgi:phage tail-like protein
LSDPSEAIRLAGGFIFEVDGQQIGMFKEVNGLRADVTVETLEEGGQNNFVHKLPGRLSWPNLVMRRGVTDTDNLFQWFLKSSGDGFEGAGQKLERTTAAVTLVNHSGQRVQAWELVEAFPVRWEGPRLAADLDEMAMEELEIAHHGFRSTKP